MSEGHTPGARAVRSPRQDRDLVDAVNRIREEDHSEVHEDLLYLYHRLTVAARPVLDQLMVRAYPAGDARLLCSAPVAEQLERLYRSVLDDLGDHHYSYDDAEALEARLLELASDHLAAVLIDSAHDVVCTETDAFDRIGSRDDLLTELQRRHVSPTSVLVHLCEAMGPQVERTFGRVPNPIETTVATVAAMVRRLDESQVIALLDETIRSLCALERMSDVRRFRVMIVGWQQSKDRRSRRPGTGFLTVAELSELFPSITSLKVKISQAVSQHADMRVRLHENPHRTRRLAVEHRTRGWKVGADLIAQAHRVEN